MIQFKITSPKIHNPDPDRIRLASKERVCMALFTLHNMYVISELPDPLNQNVWRTQLWSVPTFHIIY